MIINNVSFKTLILNLLKQRLGLVEKQGAPKAYHDLDRLAGTWSKKDAKIFKAATADFEKIDEA